MTILLLLLIAQQPYQASIEDQGLRVQLQVSHLDTSKLAGSFTEGDDLLIRFAISDAGGKPLTSLYPAAWMDPRNAPTPTDARLCARKAQTFMSGSIFAKSEVDLNVFYAVALNSDGTITVVDPLFGFGGSRLLGMTRLASPGDDWVKAADQQTLFVTQPKAGKLAAVSTLSWEIQANVPAGDHPGKLLLQPDQTFLWVAARDGLRAFKSSDLSLAAHLPDLVGAVDLVVDRDSRYLFAALHQKGRLAIVDLRTQALLKTLSVKKPVSLAYSSTTGSVLVASGDGTIRAIDARRHTQTAEMTTNPGLRQVAFAPGGRLAIAVNPKSSEIAIVDAVRGRIVQTGSVGPQPAQVSFSDDLAYVLHQGTDTVYMVPLAEIGTEGAPIPLIDFPGTKLPLSNIGEQTLVNALVKAPAERAVIFPHPSDGAIYYYREGMAAPMGQFKNYSRVPKAVMVLDRSLQEISQAGVYQSTAHVDKPGIYDIVFFLENPRLIHCFELPVAVDPAAQARRRAAVVKISWDIDNQKPTMGSSVRIAFNVNGHGDQPITGLRKVKLLATTPGGAWHKRLLARADGPGRFVVDFTPPRLGTYYLHAKLLDGPAVDPNDYATIQAQANQESL